MKPLKLALITSLVFCLSCSDSPFHGSGSPKGNSESKVEDDDVKRDEEIDVENEFEVCAGEESGRDIVLILDSTTSVSATNWNAFITIVNAILAKLNLGDGKTKTKYAVFEFANSLNKSFDEALAQNKINFLAGEPSNLSSNPLEMQNINAANHRKLFEGSYDGVGPAILRASEYLDRVGRDGSSKEIWAIHDMSCCGFPTNGETGTQIQDAESVRNAGKTIVGIRTLRSLAIGDQLASPGLAFDLGVNITEVSDTVLKEIAGKVQDSICSE